MEGDDCIKTCHTILHSKENPMSSGCAAGGVTYYQRHWSPGQNLQVYFRCNKLKFPTWRMESHPRKECITSEKILEIANIWSRRGGHIIPKFVLTENEEDSQIRVFLSGKFLAL